MSKRQDMQVQMVATISTKKDARQIKKVIDKAMLELGAVRQKVWLRPAAEVRSETDITRLMLKQMNKKLDKALNAKDVQSNIQRNSAGPNGNSVEDRAIHREAAITHTDN